MKKAKLAVFAAVAAFSTASLADTVFSEDFNSTAYRGGGVLPSSTSDNWASTGYYWAAAANGWSFAGPAMFAQKNGATQTDGAILLNEWGGSASHAISGLTAGSQYTLSFDVWGDNRPGNQWRLDVSLNGSLANSFFGTVQAAGHYAGTPPRETLTFTATGTSMTLAFAENNTALGQWSDGSPIIDNISVASLPVTAPVPEPETYAMMLAGLGLLGLARRRRAR